MTMRTYAAYATAVAAIAITLLAGVLYGSGSIGVGGAYLACVVALVLVLPALDRWDQARHRRPH